MLINLVCSSRALFEEEEVNCILFVRGSELANARTQTTYASAEPEGFRFWDEVSGFRV